MDHADWLIERILFLEGLPNLQDLGKLFIGENVKEILECDLKTEQMAVPVLRDAIEYCEKVRDYGSRDLFNKILHNEEEHIDYPRNAVRPDQPDRHPELHPAAVQAELGPGAGIGSAGQSSRIALMRGDDPSLQSIVSRRTHVARTAMA